MPNTSLKSKYESSWKVRLLRNPNEQFSHYERNWVLPPLFKRHEKVLDLASGNSIVGSYLHQKFHCDVLAYDISAKAISAAKKKGVKGIVGSVEKKFPFKTATFDLVFWGDNIEHILGPKKTLQEIHRVIKPGGRLILSTPNQAYWRYRLYMFTRGMLPKTEGEDNPPWEWEHIRFFNRPVVKQLLMETGFAETTFLGASRRRIDKLFVRIFPELFGMVMVIEAKKV